MNISPNRYAGAALAVLFAFPAATRVVAAEQAPAAAAATPRTPDGHPDLDGFWRGSAFVNILNDPSAPPTPGGDVSLTLRVRNGIFDNLTNDENMAMRTDASRLPKYKPEFWEKVQDLDLHGNKLDPYVTCKPAGVPRLGAPTQIVQKDNLVVLFYGGGAGRSEFRMIPTDGRKHNPDPDGTWNGDAVGHWEGDTLVVETVGLTEDSWLSGTGYFHSYDMKVTERFRREGDKLYYDVKIEDPAVLMEPWAPGPEGAIVGPDRSPASNVLTLVKGPQALVPEGTFCSDRDAAHMVGNQRE